jgi:aryl-alcohol dehydrogenase-like predicted oxidoreductase
VVPAGEFAPDGMIEFGLGTIGIGKPWGYANPEVPGEGPARRLLERAYALGVRYLDTAPSYGVSEQRISGFLAGLTKAERDGLRIATKFGEHWDAARGEPYVDHTFDALRRSLDDSVERLGRVDYLQLHKTTPEMLRSRDLARAWEYAASLGIRTIGASVSDAESAEAAIGEPAYGIVQLPFHAEQETFGPWIDRARARGMWIAVNRPFGMGRTLYENRELTKSAAFAFILRKGFDGVILSGTKSLEHLEENWQAFADASR